MANLYILYTSVEEKKYLKEYAKNRQNGEGISWFDDSEIFLNYYTIEDFEECVWMLNGIMLNKCNRAKKKYSALNDIINGDADNLYDGLRKYYMYFSAGDLKRLKYNIDCYLGISDGNMESQLTEENKEKIEEFNEGEIEEYELYESLLENEELASDEESVRLFYLFLILDSIISFQEEIEADIEEEYKGVIFVYK